MVILCLGALALLCWPARPGLFRPGTAVVPAPTSVGRRRGRRWAQRRTGRQVGTLGVLAVGAVAVPAGPAAGCAALLIAATVALLVSAELRRRRDSKQIDALLVATRTLAREVRTGAGPGAAVLATAAAHPGCATALDQLAVAVAGRRGGIEPCAGGSLGGGPAQPEDPQAHVLVRLADGWQLSTRHGVPWAALIDTVAADLADRQRSESLRNAQVAGPRVSGYVLAVMPALGILLGAGMGADPVHVLLGTGVGSILLLVGSALTCLGLAWTASIVRS